MSVAALLRRLEKVQGHDGCWNARCPAHNDRRPSLRIAAGSDGRVLLYCHAGCSIGDVCRAVGIEQKDLFEERPARVRAGVTGRSRARHEFGPPSARAVWAMARERARDDEHVDADRGVYRYLEQRGLAECWGSAAYGVLSTGMELQPSVAIWPRSGHRLIAALVDANGEVANVQARRVTAGSPKTLFPKGSRSRGLVFANDAGVSLLKEEASDSSTVVLGEGMTDYLALSIVATLPVLCAPGASVMTAAVGDWIRGRDLMVIADSDEAGQGYVEPVARAAFRNGARRVRYVVWPDRVGDACDALRALGQDGLESFLAHEIERFNDAG